MITIIKINEGFVEKNVYEENFLPKDIKKLIKSNQPHVLCTQDKLTYIINNEHRKIQPFVKRYIARIGKDPIVFYVFTILGLGLIQLILILINIFSGPNFEEIYKNLSQNVINMDKNFQEKIIKIQTNFDQINGNINGINEILTTKTLGNVK